MCERKGTNNRLVDGERNGLKIEFKGERVNSINKLKWFIYIVILLNRKNTHILICTHIHSR